MLSLNFTPFPQLETGRLILRQITVEDVDALLKLRSNGSIMKYISRPLATSKKDALDLIQKLTDALHSNEGITWGISLKDNPTLIGTIGYWQIIKEHYRAEIGYLLDEDQQGKGLMHEALTEVINFGFNTLKFHSIEAIVQPDNVPSISLLKKSHFIKEAYFRENFYFEGKFLDSETYSLIFKDQD